MSTTIATGVVTARKDHQCDDCGLRIETGDPYRRSAIAGDHTSWTWKEHMNCAADADQMLNDNWFDTDDWPSQFSFLEMQAELHAARPTDPTGSEA